MEYHQIIMLDSCVIPWRIQRSFINFISIIKTTVWSILSFLFSGFQEAKGFTQFTNQWILPFHLCFWKPLENWKLLQIIYFRYKSDAFYYFSFETIKKTYSVSEYIFFWTLGEKTCLLHTNQMGLSLENSPTSLSCGDLATFHSLSL